MRPPVPAPLGQAWSSVAYHGRRRRRSWVGERIHVEVRGLAAEPGSDPLDRRRLAAAVEAELSAVDGVSWAVVNPVLARVVVAFKPAPAPAPGEAGEPGGRAGRHGEVVAAIERAEASVGASHRRMPVGLAAHPGDAEPAWSALSALVADVAGLGLGLAGSALRRSPLPTDIAALAGLADSEPHIRSLVSDLVGPITADLVLAVTNATSQGLAQGPVGVLSDLAWRAVSYAEARSRSHGWAAAEPELCAHPERATAPFIAGRPRPVPLPGGAVERYADRSLAVGAIAGLSAAVTTGDVSRAGAGLYAGLPKAARLGRETFAVHVTRRLCGRGAVVLDPTAFRRLDRVDTVLVDWGSSRPGSEGTAVATAFATEPPRWVRAVVAAARRAGHMVVVAADPTVVRGLGGDLSVVGGGHLVEDVRRLQHDGCVVLLVTDADAAVADALWAADVSIGVREPGGGVAWSADVIVGAGDAWWLVEASGAAREVVNQSVALAVMGTATAAAVVFARPQSGRYGWAVNVAALVAMANATRVAFDVARRDEPAAAPESPPWHALSGEEVMALVGSTRAGLSLAEAAARVCDEQRPPPPLLRLAAAVVEELSNPLTPVLAGGAAVSAALGGAVDAGIVAGVTAANALLGGLQRWRTAQAADSLAHAGDVTVHVRREGVLHAVETRDVVVGDIIVLRAGDVVPADARILEADGVLADEASVTGESVPVVKDARATEARIVADHHSMLHADTTVVAGEALAVVVATGAGTRSGAAMGGETLRAGGVEARLGDLTRRAVPVSLGAGAAVVAAGVLRGRPLAGSLAGGVSLAVAAVPEGLPLVATMAQLSSAGRLARQGALVRNHRAIEALGRVDVLCTDKTGTLTAGHLAVRAVSDLRQTAALAEITRPQRRALGAALRATPAVADGRALAHPTDASIVAAAGEAGVTEAEGHPSWARVGELPFEPAQGFHATVGRVGDRLVVSVKGAPEVVLPRCSTSMAGAVAMQAVRAAGSAPAAGVAGAVGPRTSGRSGRGSPLTAAVRSAVEEEVERLARRGLRVLAIAEGGLRGAAAADGGIDDGAVHGLTLVGLVAIADPVRPEAASAVRGIQDAGVRVCMVTGDHPSTAEGIAAELGILNGHRVIGGAELAMLSDDDLDTRIDGVSVFARVTPTDKVRIVQSLQRIGRVVAMTGDGANDAPAIRLADVGVAMGSRSTPAARQAADVIVTNDDVETIIAAIAEGRALWGSVRDALSILLGGNLGEIAFTLAGAVLSGRAPLNTRQLLLVNLMTDVAPALAIATRPPPRKRAEELLGEGPDRSLGRPLERAILGRAAITALGATLAWAPARVTGRGRRASTVALVALVGTQLTQTLTTGGRHPMVLVAGLGSAAVLVAIVQTPGVSRLFGCVPLGPLAWCQVGAGVGAATVVSVVEPMAARAAAALAGHVRDLASGSGAEQ